MRLVPEAEIGGEEQSGNAMGRRSVAWSEGQVRGNVLGTDAGVIKVRSIRRKGTAQARWNADVWGRVKGTPWEPVPGREGVEVMSKVELPPAPVEVPPMADGPKWEQDWRRPKIERKDVRNLGMTPGCPGCVAANRGSAARRHTE